MRASLFVCIAAALSTGCANNPTVPVAAHQAGTAAAPVTANASNTQVAQAGQPVALEIVNTGTSAAKTAQGDDLVCKEIATLGTRLTRRVCRTQAQIAADREEAKKKTSTLTSRGTPYQEKPMKMEGPSQ